jgi:hypothetical protein
VLSKTYVTGIRKTHCCFAVPRNGNYWQPLVDTAQLLSIVRFHWSRSSYLNDETVYKGDSECSEKEHALSPFFFNFALDYIIRKVQKKKKGLELKGKYQLVVCAYGVELFY